MGKRKCHGRSYYTCDWSGFPMRNSGVYMPSWVGNKLVKRGQYMNWEAVLSHSRAMHTPEVFEKVRAHVEDATGGPVHNLTSPDDFGHWGVGAHLGGMDLDSRSYTALCEKVHDPITAVKITTTGEVFEVVVSPENERFDLESFIRAPVSGVAHELCHLTAPRRGRIRRDREVIAYYLDCFGSERNMLASNCFKVNLHGDVIVFLKTMERGRVRLVSLNANVFKAGFIRPPKRKREDPAQALTEGEYDEIRAELKRCFRSYEERASASSRRPDEIAHAAVMPSPTGQELATVARLLGHVPPEKLKALERRLVAQVDAQVAAGP